MNKFDEIYQNIIKDIMVNGIEEFNLRTGLKTKSLPGVNFSIDIEKDGFPVLTLRKQPIKSPIAEQIWFIQGEQNTDFLRKYTKIWDKFLESDKTLSTAYGYRWRKHFNRDQIYGALRTLQKDSSSRQVVIIAWDPESDGLDSPSKKNVPCPYTFTLNIIGNRLHMHNIVRSNDMILGCPFDVFGFALLQCIFAQYLNIKPGIYTHSISNAHIYENHYSAANELIVRECNHGKINLSLPDDTFIKAEEKDDKLVDIIYNNINEQYYPQSEIKNLSIAV